MSFVDDVVDSQAEAEKAAKERIVFPGTISSIDPLTVILDGSGVAIPCLNFAMLPVKEGRRVGVIKLGSDYVLFGTFGSNVLGDLSIDNDLYIGDDVTITGDIFWGGSTAVEAHLDGPISNISAVAVYIGLWVPFQAPPSGKVNIHWSARLKTGVLNTIAYVGYELRTGAVNGGGSTVTGHTVATDRCIETRGNANALYSMGRSKLATPLTPNAQYHVRVMHGSSDASGATETSNIDITVTMEI